MFGLFFRNVIKMNRFIQMINFTLKDKLCLMCSKKRSVCFTKELSVSVQFPEAEGNKNQLVCLKSLKFKRKKLKVMSFSDLNSSVEYLERHYASLKIFLYQMNVIFLIPVVLSFPDFLKQKQFSNLLDDESQCDSQKDW